MRRFTKRTGFTLIEIMVVISILGVLSTMVSRNQGAVLERSRDAALMTEVGHIRNAVHQFALENQGVFPPDLEALQKFLRRPVREWRGGKGSGRYLYDPQTGAVTLSDAEGSAANAKADCRGKPYGEY